MRAVKNGGGHVGQLFHRSQRAVRFVITHAQTQTGDSQFRFDRWKVVPENGEEKNVNGSGIRYAVAKLNIELIDTTSLNNFHERSQGFYQVKEIWLQTASKVLF